MEGLHLLVVPSTSVSYNEEVERRSQYDTKQRQLQRFEALKEAREEVADGEDQNQENKDGFLLRLAANIIKNLQVTINKVHLRYEDNNPNSDARKPFAAGVTLDQLLLQSPDNVDQEKDEKLKLFGKNISLTGFAIYWKPQTQLYSTDNLYLWSDDEIKSMFNSTIGTKDLPAKKLKYLLYPCDRDSYIKHVIDIGKL